MFRAANTRREVHLHTATHWFDRASNTGKPSSTQPYVQTLTWKEPLKMQKASRPTKKSEIEQDGQ